MIKIEPIDFDFEDIIMRIVRGEQIYRASYENNGIVDLSCKSVKQIRKDEINNPVRFSYFKVVKEQGAEVTNE